MNQVKNKILTQIEKHMGLLLIHWMELEKTIELTKKSNFGDEIKN